MILECIGGKGIFLMKTSITTPYPLCTSSVQTIENPAFLLVPAVGTVPILWLKQTINNLFVTHCSATFDLVGILHNFALEITITGNNCALLRITKRQSSNNVQLPFFVF